MSSVFRFDDVPFAQRLAETIAWCTRHASADNPSGSLRSEHLIPPWFERDRACLVRSVAQSRSVLGEAPTATSLEGGRLLVYFPDSNLADGAAELESNGYFDIHNVPPWDTWIALAREPTPRDESTDEYLITWVPPALIPIAQRGIDVNPEECILWLEDAPITARDELRRFLR